MEEINNRNFINVFSLEPDKTKPGRTLSTVKIGGVYMSRLIIDPGVTTGNYYHKKTSVMFYVESGSVVAIFENVVTKEHEEGQLRGRFPPNKESV